MVAIGLMPPLLYLSPPNAEHGALKQRPHTMPPISQARLAGNCPGKN